MSRRRDPEIVVARSAALATRRGHPWIFRGALVRGHGSAEPTVARIASEDGEVFASGLYDPSSPIALRVWSVRVGNRPPHPVDADLFRDRLRAAISRRRRWFDETTTACRWLHGEGDRTPGFVIDRYDDVAVLRTDGLAAATLAPALTRDLEAELRAAGITTLLERRVAQKGSAEVVVRFGSPRDVVTAREDGVPLVADLVRGQKTGAFLDQRDNRRRVGELIARRVARGEAPRVLNLFSYSGGFSLRAALAGATVTSVDVATRAHATAQSTFRLAGVDPGRHAFVTADAFAYLADAAKARRAWDVVISDPPSFAPNERSKAKALSAYRGLHKACAAVLADGGTFLAASCSSHVTAEDFLTTLDDEVLERDDLRLVALHGPPPDHPTLPAFPEGRYLKLAILE